MKRIAETERLLLRVFEVEDVDDVKRFWGDDEVMEHCLGAIPHEAIPRVLEAYANCHFEKALSVYAVVEKESGKVIGAAGFNVTDKVELIYHYAKEVWGKGYATEAANACVNVAKKQGMLARLLLQLILVMLVL
ncbi:GNAT family N-acetyltransferase [Fredinandcohnia humi]